MGAIYLLVRVADVGDNGGGRRDRGQGNGDTEWMVTLIAQPGFKFIPLCLS